MSKRTLFLIFALFIIVAVLLMIALYNPYSSNPKSGTTVTVPKEPIAQTTLSFGETISSPSAREARETYSIPINIATGTNKVTAIQLELQYDPKVLTSVSVTPGVFFKNPVVLLNHINVKTGRISYAFGINPGEQGVIGKGIAAILTFGTKAESDSAKAGALQQTQILFLPKTLVTAQDITQSVLKQTSNAEFTVGIVPSTAPSASPNAQ